MSKQANPTRIGAFILGAIALLAIGIVAFGGSEIFAKRQVYVSYFDENTKGLRVGANVVMNGVRVGQVTAVALQIDYHDYQTLSEVTFEILGENFIVTRDGDTFSEGLPETVSHEFLIESGLRTTLQVDSFVTGQLSVELSFHPESEAVFRGGERALYLEIPTTPSFSQEVQDRVETFFSKLDQSLDVNKVGKSLEEGLHGLSELANSEDLRQILAGVNAIVNSAEVKQTLAGVDTLVNRKETQELTVSLEKTLAEIRAAANDASGLLQNADSQIASLKPTIDKVNSALGEAEAALAAARTTLRGDSKGAHELGETLREVKAAMRSLREFLDFLERNPEALIRGKQQ
ncbi:MAG: MlaD family protein [Gammaproteobacteria bacterium]|nr:MlaD family protein [Gammaproteobacteria bacterium]